MSTNRLAAIDPRLIMELSNVTKVTMNIEPGLRPDVFSST